MNEQRLGSAVAARARLNAGAVLGIGIGVIIGVLVRPNPRELIVKVEPAASVAPQAALEVVAAETEAWRALTAELKAMALRSGLAPAIDTREWLALDEASEYSGLPSQVLAGLLRSDKPPVSFTGRGPKTWRIQRSSLDAYGKAAHP